jgi:hypothetical protein
MIDDELKWAFKAFFWSRGIVAAIVTLAVLESVFGWDRVSFLEFTHTIVSHWNVVTAHMFTWLMQPLPNSPPEAYARNLIMLGLIALGPTIAFLLSDGVLARRRSMRIATVIGLVGYWLWVAMFWNADLKLPTDADMVLKIMGALFLVTYPYGFALGAIFGLGYTELGREQSKAMFAALTFVLTLEALYHVPQIKASAANYVSYVNGISDERDSSPPRQAY